MRTALALTLFAAGCVDAVKLADPAYSNGGMMMSTGSHGAASTGESGSTASSTGTGGSSSSTGGWSGTSSGGSTTTGGWNGQGGPCTTASDCTAPPGSNCTLCLNGDTACNHWDCTDSQCNLALCEEWQESDGGLGTSCQNVQQCQAQGPVPPSSCEWGDGGLWQCQTGNVCSVWCP